MKMCFRNRLAGVNITNDDAADILANLPFFFYLKSTVKKLLLQLICGNINIYIIF